jgi:ABC-type Na+ transport system ATPase subunit NatA
MPSSTVKTTKDELLQFFKQMYTMRRMEITNDTEYKVSQQVSWASMSTRAHLFCDICRREIFVASAICTMDKKPSLPACTLP